MENKDTYRNLLVAATIFLVVMWLGPRLLPLPPAPSAADRTAISPPTDGTKDTEQSTAPARPSGATSQAPASPGGRAEDAAFRVMEADAASTFFLGADPAVGTKLKPEKAEYRMRLVLSNVGAAIETATITDHAENLGDDERYRLLSPVVGADERTYRSLGVERINVDGADLILDDKRWHASEVTSYKDTTGESSAGSGEKLDFSIDIHHEGAAALRLTRTFRLPRQSQEDGRHDLFTEVSVANLDGQPHRVLLAYHGGVGIRQANPRLDDRFVDFGIHTSAAQIVGNRKAYGNVLGQASRELRLFESAADAQARPVWAATANTYFTCTIAPLAEKGEEYPAYLAEVAAFDADGSATTGNDLTLRFVTKAVELPPGQTITYAAEAYLGEKEVDGFRNVAAYRQRNYYYQISQGYGICTFSWLVEMMIWLLNALHGIVRDFGVAIIILVLVVRAILHPITKKGQVNMVRMQHKMQELAPKIEEIKKRYANDKARLNQEMMKLNINPAGQMLTCLPMFLQMPIWVALYISLSNNILMRHEPFHFTWIHDLTAPDALIHFSGPFSLPLFGKIASLNLLPFLLAIAMYLQQKLQPKPKPSPNMSDQQKQQQEMMQKMGPLMSVMMFFIFYNMPSGLTLYIMSSSFFGTIEQWHIRKHIKEREAAGTLHKAVRAANGDGVFARLKKAGKPAIFERLQKMAEEAQKLQSQRVKGKPRR